MNAMDRYVSEFEANSKIAPEFRPTDYSQAISHTTQDEGAVISIPLSSQLQAGVGGCWGFPFAPGLLRLGRVLVCEA
jgi:hypothetical protein